MKSLVRLVITELAVTLQVRAILMGVWSLSSTVSEPHTSRTNGMVIG
jgi:hypothetical protein